MGRPLYIDLGHLQLFHYFYFGLGIFSLVSSFYLFVFLPVYSFFLGLLFIFHSIVSWFVALFIRKKLESVMILDSPKTVLTYLLVTIIAAIVTVLYWFYNMSQIESIANGVIFLDYFLFFIGIIWIFVANSPAVDQYFVESKTKQWQVVVKPTEAKVTKELQKAKAVHAIKEVESLIRDLREEGKETEKVKDELKIAQGELFSKNYVNAYVFAIVAKKLAERERNC